MKDLSVSLVAKKIRNQTGTVSSDSTVESSYSTKLEHILFDAKAVLHQEKIQTKHTKKTNRTSYSKDIIYPMLATLRRWSAEKSGGRAKVLNSIGVTPEVIDQVQKELFQEESHFREFPLQRFSSTRYKMPVADKNDFRKVLKEAAKTVGGDDGIHFRYSGFWTKSNTKKDEIFYNFTYYPRTRVPRISFKKYQVAIAHLSEALWEYGLEVSRSTIEGKFDDPRAKHAEKDCRILLGRRVGYEKSASVHTKKDFKALLGDRIAIEWADIYSVDIDGEYEEPGALLYVKTEDISYIYQFAHFMQQERFTVEYFKKGMAYTVEVYPYCTIPDPNPEKHDYQLEEKLSALSNPSKR